MGFFGGVITGVAVTAGAAAWYMSRSGERFRDQYRVDRKLGEFGDQLEARTREIQASVNTQIAGARAKGDSATDRTVSAVGDDESPLDDTRAAAAEAAAELAAKVETKAARIRQKATAAPSE